MPSSDSLDHIRFPLRVRHTPGHVFIEDAAGRPRSSVAYTKGAPGSFEFAKFVCTTLARAMTDRHDTLEKPTPAEPTEPLAPPDELTFKLELWFHDSAVQQTLARTAKR